METQQTTQTDPMLAALADLEKKLAARDPDMKAAIASVEALKKRIDAFEIKAGRPGMGGLSTGRKSFVDLVLSSPEFEPIGKGQKREGRWQVSEKFNPFFAHVGEKALSDTAISDLASAVGGAIITPYYVPGIQAPPPALPRIRDLVTNVPVTSDVVYWRKALGFVPLSTTLSAAVLIGGNSFVPKNEKIGGFYVGQAVEFEHGTANSETAVVSAVSYTTYTVTLASAFTKNHAVNTEVRANFLGTTPQTYLKPTAVQPFQQLTCNIQTLATLVDVTTQMLADVPALQAFLTQQLQDAMIAQENEQILYGGGGNGALGGIVSDPNISVVDMTALPAGTTYIDAVLRAKSLCELARYPASAVLINPMDNFAMISEKYPAAGGAPLYMFQITGNWGQSLFGIPVISHPSVHQGTAFVAAWKQAVTLFDRQQTMVEFFPQHADNVARNLVTVRAEQRLCLGVSRPEAIVEILFGTPGTSS